MSSTLTPDRQPILHIVRDEETGWGYVSHCTLAAGLKPIFKRFLYSQSVAELHALASNCGYVPFAHINVGRKLDAYWFTPAAPKSESDRTRAVDLALVGI